MKNRIFENALYRLSSLIHKSELDTDDRFLVEFNSDGELSVCGCKELMQYTENDVMMDCERFFVCVKGKEMYLGRVFGKKVNVCGFIDSISFLRR